MNRSVAVIVLVCGLALIAPLVIVLVWLESQSTVGVGIDLETWQFWGILLSPVIGIGAIVWSLTKLLRRPPT